jgi:hypothetical protein
MNSTDHLERIPHVAGETVRSFFKRYEEISPNGRSLPYRVEMKLYYDQYHCMMLPLIDGQMILQAIYWCVDHVDQNDWYNRGIAFYFTHEADAAFFKLQFSTVTCWDF